MAHGQQIALFISLFLAFIGIIQKHARNAIYTGKTQMAQAQAL